MATTQTNQPDPNPLPESLRRVQPTKSDRQAEIAKKIASTHNQQVKPATPQVPAMPGTAPLGIKPAKTVKAKPAPKAKTAKAKTEKPHQPTKVQRTEGNPAKSIVPVRFKQAYAAHDDSCGDKVATALKQAIEKTNEDGRPSLDMGALASVAKDNGIDFAAYQHLNNGQKRMNVGNRLRGLLKAGKKVVIGKQTFANAEKALAKPAA